MKYVKAWVNLVVMIVLTILSIFLAPKVLLLFMPFIIGWILSLLANPLVHFFEEKLKIKRKAGSALVIVSVISGICIGAYFLTGKLVREVAGLVHLLPQMWRNVRIEFAAIGDKWETVIDRFPREVVTRVEQIGGTLGQEMGTMIGRLSVPTADAVGSFAQSIPNVVISLIMCLLSAYFFVAEKNHVEQVVGKYMPKSWRQKCSVLKKTTIDVLVGYIKAQFKIEIWIYLIIAAGLLFLKVRYGYLIAIPIALLDILPVFGTGTVLVPWAVFKLLGGDYVFALGLVVIWGVSQVIRQVIQPKMIGESMGMPPLPTLILLYVGYKLAGVAGMIFAVPLGILVVSMNEAGFFDNCKLSVRIIWQGFESFRHFSEEEKKGLPGEKNEEEL